MKDLVVLVADKDMEHTMAGLFSRPEALGIRPIEFDLFIHPEHDPGCALRGVAFLSNFAEQYSHGLLMFDHEGSGRESNRPGHLQESLNEDLSGTTWGERARAIVLSPELEAWIWNGSPHVDEVAGWTHRQPGLRRWLVEQDWLEQDAIKPGRPKEAFQAALREARTARSSSLYQHIAERVSLRRCTDTVFQELKDTLQRWFPRQRRQGKRQ